MAADLNVPMRLRQWSWWLTDARYRRATRAISTLVARKWKASQAIWPQVDGRVATGPFQGMRYLPPTPQCPLTPKLVGTYEKELWPVVDRIVYTPYRVVVDIGAAEGFYACGLACRMPGAHVVAFEAQVDLHARLREITSMNGVADRVRIHGSCSREALRQALGTAAPALVVCDIDGGEDSLLDPAAVPALASVDLLVEVHDDIVPGISAKLAGRFAGTHAVELIPRQARTARDWPASLVLEPALLLSAMDEQRPDGNFWFWMKARLR